MNERTNERMNNGIGFLISQSPWASVDHQAIFWILLWRESQASHALQRSVPRRGAARISLLPRRPRWKPQAFFGREGACSAPRSTLVWVVNAPQTSVFSDPQPAGPAPRPGSARAFRPPPLSGWSPRGSRTDGRRPENRPARLPKVLRSDLSQNPLFSSPARSLPPPLTFPPENAVFVVEQVGETLEKSETKDFSEAHNFKIECRL